MSIKKSIEVFFKKKRSIKQHGILRGPSLFQYDTKSKKKLYFKNKTVHEKEETKLKILGNYYLKKCKDCESSRYKNLIITQLKKNKFSPVLSSFVYKYMVRFYNSFQNLFFLQPFFFKEKTKKTIGTPEIGHTLNLIEQHNKPLTKVVVETEYWLQKYQRSNQDTSLNQRPSVEEGEWVQKGDFLSDSSASVSGELALGKNILVGYMPWEGYNFEDAIVLNERLVSDSIYTSLHIEKYEIQTAETLDGEEQITKQIYELIFPEKFLSKKTSKKKKSIELTKGSSENSSGRRSKLLDCNQDKIKKNNQNKKNFSNLRYGLATNKTLHHLDDTGVVKVGTWIQPDDILVAKVTPFAIREFSPQEKFFYTVLEMEPAKYKDTSLRVPQTVQGRVIGVHIVENLHSISDKKVSGPQRVQIFIAKQRAIQIGDKMAGRHGNKGIVSTILPRADMPYLPDGTPLDIILNPLGVPSRMNVGQVFESLLGLASSYLHQDYKILPFDEMNGPESSRSLVYSKLYEARVKTGQEWLFQTAFPGKTKLFDGRTGNCFSQAVTVGQAYILKLSHLVDKKIHARATGPYSLITQQPVRGRAHHGGQRLGEMEVWAFEGFGASYSLQECLTIKSDDITGRLQLITAIAKDRPIPFGTPEAFQVVTSELQALCLNMKILNSQNFNFKDPQILINYKTSKFSEL